jgi:hypothetical protein
MFSTAFEFTVSRYQDGWCVEHGGSPVMTAKGKQRITHSNKLFLTAMVEEFQSFGDVSFTKDRAIKPIFFSQYALWSDHLLVDWKQKLIENLQDLLFRDMTFVENAGPERVDQIAASSSVYDWLKVVVAAERVVAKLIANTVYHETYSMMTQEEAEDPDLYEGIDIPDNASGANFYTRSTIIDTEFFQKLKALVQRSSAETCSALHGLLSMNGHLHFLSSLALVQGGISKAQYATATMSSLNLRHGIQSDVDRDEHRSMYQAALHEADIALTFINLTKNAIMELIKTGENADVEFKESLSLDVRRSNFEANYVKVKEAKIELSALKTILGFLNAKGGKLFIGVSDDANAKGIGKELKAFHHGSTDKFLLYLKDLIVARIGKGILGNLSINLHKEGEEFIVIVDVKKSSEPCFLKPDDIFYVRTSPATEQLSDKDLLDYIRNNFP